MDPYFNKRLLRRPWFSILSLIIAGTLCFLICSLSGYRQEQQDDLEQIRGNYTINCVVTDARGVSKEKLFLSHRYTDFILDENGLLPLIKDIRMIKTFACESDETGNAVLYGVTSEKCDPLLDPAIGGGYSTDRGDFFESEEYLLLVPQSVYASIGTDTLKFTVRDSYAAGLFDTKTGKGEVEFKIAGRYYGVGKFFMPYPAAQKLAVMLTGVGSTDSASFTLADNTRLDELKARASEVFHDIDPGEVNDGNFALTIQDKQYKATVAALEQNIRRTGYLLPVIMLLGFGAGLLIGVLATRSETRSYALMRTVGMRAKKLLLSVLAEQQLLPLIACAVIAAVSKRPLPALLFFICQLAGCLIAVIKPIFARPTALLRVQE